MTGRASRQLEAQPRSQAARDGNETLADQVYKRIAADVVSGRLAPDTKLAFHLLKDRYGVSVSTAREALQRLAGEQLVESTGHRGFRVAPLSLEEFQDLNALRIVLEPRALRESLLHGKSDWEERVLIASHRLERTPRPLQPDEQATDQWEESHRAYHAALISASPSKWLMQFCRILYDQSSRYRRFILTQYSSEESHRIAVNLEHKALTESALARDVEKAEALLIGHYENTAHRIMARYEFLA